MFQFQTGSIRSLQNARIQRRNTKGRFNSKLVRLEVSVLTPFQPKPLDRFNSKLVRLKVRCALSRFGQ